MFDKLLSFLAAPGPEQSLSPSDGKLAMAALLVRVARADHDYAPREVAMIDQLLAARYQLDGAGTKVLRTQAEALELQAPDTVRFTRTLKAAVPYEDRQSVVQALWAVVLADGSRADEENGFLRLVANLLGVNDRDSALARQKAAKALR